MEWSKGRLPGQAILGRRRLRRGRAVWAVRARSRCARSLCSRHDGDDEDNTPGRVDGQDSSSHLASVALLLRGSFGTADLEFARGTHFLQRETRPHSCESLPPAPLIPNRASTAPATEAPHPYARRRSSRFGPGTSLLLHRQLEGANHPSFLACSPSLHPLALQLRSPRRVMSFDTTLPSHRSPLHVLSPRPLHPTPEPAHRGHLGWLRQCATRADELGLRLS